MLIVKQWDYKYLNPKAAKHGEKLKGNNPPLLLSQQMFCLHSWINDLRRWRANVQLLYFVLEPTFWFHIVPPVDSWSGHQSFFKCPFYNFLWIMRLNSTDTQSPHYPATSLSNPEDLALHFRQCLVVYSFMPAWTRKSFHSCLGGMGINCLLQMNGQICPCIFCMLVLC